MHLSRSGVYRGVPSQRACDNGTHLRHDIITLCVELVYLQFFAFLSSAYIVDLNDVYPMESTIAIFNLEDSETCTCVYVIRMADRILVLKDSFELYLSYMYQKVHALSE